MPPEHVNLKGEIALGSLKNIVYLKHYTSLVLREETQAIFIRLY